MSPCVFLIEFKKSYTITDLDGSEVQRKFIPREVGFHHIGMI